VVHVIAKEILLNLFHSASLHTFTVSVLIPQHSTFLDVSVALKQHPYVFFRLLFVEHSNKQLPVFCNKYSKNKSDDCMTKPNLMKQCFSEGHYFNLSAGRTGNRFRRKVGLCLNRRASVYGDQ
jgi:hypothetical protein